MIERVLFWGVAVALAARMVFAAHAPAVVDAHLALVALVLAFAAGASRQAILAGALIVIGAAASVPFSWNPWISTLAIPSVVGPVAFLLLASSGRTKTAVLLGVAVGGSLNGVMAIVQRIYSWPEALRRADELGLSEQMVWRLADARTIGFSLSPDLCGGLCVAGAAAALALRSELVDRRQRALLVVAAAVSAGALVVLRSFGTALALGAAVLVVVALALLRKADKRALAIAAAGFVFAGAGLAAAVVTRGLADLAKSFGERAMNWDAALAIFGSNPLVGVGFARFPAAYLAERDPGSNVTRYAHSGFLQWLAETGALGGLCAVAATVVVALTIWRGRKELDLAKLVVLGAALVLLFRSAMDYDLQIAQSASVFAALLGLVIAPAVVDDAPPNPWHRRFMAILALLMLPLIAILGARESTLKSDDHHMILAYADAVPWDVEARLASAAHHLDQRMTCTDEDKCKAASEQARAHLAPLIGAKHPSSVAFVLSARLHLLDGEEEKALHDLDRAFAVDPGNRAAHELSMQLDPATKDSAAKWGVAPRE